MKARLISLLFTLSLLVACTPASPSTVAGLVGEAGKSLVTLPPPPPAADVPEAATSAAAPAAPTLPLPTVVLAQPPTQSVLAGFPTATPFLIGLPTVGPGATANPANCFSTPQPPFDSAWRNNPAAASALGCALGSIYQAGGAFQNFENGVMFWRESDRSIYVISTRNTNAGQASDSWWRIADTWVEGEAASDPSLIAPAGLIQPVRGFGKVWRNNGFVREALGWATGDESGIATRWHDFEHGVMMQLGDNGPIYALIPTDGPPPTTGTHTGPLRP